MIIGAHSIIYSKDAEADRVFLRDILRLPHVDVGDGWLIFGLPPAEVAIHPSGKNGMHEFYFMVNDVKAFVVEMKEHGTGCSPVQKQSWGLLTQVTLPGGGRLGVYEPFHSRPKTIHARSRPLKTSTKTSRKSLKFKSNGT
jgi:hypothetical protein